MSTDDLRTTQAFTLAVRVEELEEQVANLRLYYLQTMLAIATAAGGEFRIGAVDYVATRGRTLATFVDPKTGDRVFVAKVTVSDGEEASDGDLPH